MGTSGRFLSTLLDFRRSVLRLTEIALFSPWQITTHNAGNTRHVASEKAFGAVHFPTFCSPELQKPFDRGAALLHAFCYEEARKEFEAMAQRDSECDMTIRASR